MKMNKIWPVSILLLSLIGSASVGGVVNKMDAYNVVWDSPSVNSSGSMPLGNGDIGVNAWVEGDGDLLFYISKTDSWNEEGELLKIGRVRISLDPNPFLKGKPFKQVLNISGGEMLITAGNSSEQVDIRMWVDANRGVVWVEIDAKTGIRARVTTEIWRTPETQSGSLGYNSKTFVKQSADVVLPASGNAISWYHRNSESIWPWITNQQHLADFARTARDPIANRTFGATIKGTGLVSVDDRTIASSESTNKIVISASVLTEQTDSAEGYVKKLLSLGQQTTRLDLPSARVRHHKWWDVFWNRSYIRVSGRPDAEVVSKAYHLQRYISACGGRGAYPIKFNGSIFTVDTRDPADSTNPDYRRWGGGYWFQNTRLAYWPMIASGDWDMITPLLKMFKDIIPLARFRTKDYFGHDGTFYPETQTFYGMYLPENYGLDRTGKHHSHVDNGYIHYYWSGGLELTKLMLERYEFGQDSKFVKEYLLPISDGVIEFYDKHYKRDENGKIVFKPAGSLETWHEAVNPAPEIAGLKSVLQGLLELPGELTGDARCKVWKRMLGELPELPTETKGGHRILSPAAELLGPIMNSENPELYAVFPYHLFGVGLPNLDMANYTFDARKFPGNEGWRQDAIQLALLGRADEARRMVYGRFTNKHAGSRFDAFWGPNFDWIPDQDHGSVAVMALQTMLMQNIGQKILLMPAWPKDWDVEFKLCAPGKTTIVGVFKNGKMEKLKVSPTARRKDIVFCGPLAGSPPKITKLGTVECDLVETTPLVFNNKLYRMEWVRMAYKHTNYGDECFRLVDMATGEPSAPFAFGHIFASGMVDNDTVYAFGDQEPRHEMHVFASKDLVKWESWTAFKTDNWSLFNSSVCKTEDGKYVMAFEVGEPAEEVGVPFTCRFAVSDDLKSWSVLPREYIYSMDRYTACPTIRQIDGWYYMVYLEMLHPWEFDSYLVRSRDLKHWQSSPHNPILKYSPEDKQIANPKLTEAERKRIADAVDINNSDFDVCEFKGKTIINYSWGSQQGQEFLAQAEYDGTMKEFFEGFFPQE